MGTHRPKSPIKVVCFRVAVQKLLTLFLGGPELRYQIMSNEIVAAGGVIVDRSTDTPKVLLVHRPRYDDWSFPKGKLDPGESIEEAALREVREETGIQCKILRKVAALRYVYQTRNRQSRPKVVHYFLMEPINKEVRVPGVEVDRGEWLDFEIARKTLSYKRDRELLDSL
jgi:8-oxo-dGTP pyrophosphatase MutT (NUDIX family)